VGLGVVGEDVGDVRRVGGLPGLEVSTDPVRDLLLGNFHGLSLVLRQQVRKAASSQVCRTPEAGAFFRLSRVRTLVRADKDNLEGGRAS
jgi:hypothetical protein